MSISRVTPDNKEQLLDTASKTKQLLKNPDFEAPFTNADWKARACAVTQYAGDAYTGTHSYKISNA